MSYQVLARILAKSLNCETGISSRPCGKCSACVEIDAGRFIDLIEVDAATNTKVDEMRQLLENSVYAPTRGRFKVYVIDEVHMLSTSAFNAMLKTLEEPPEHIKFILATTDPQKIPVTVLSRCLQFNLKQMPSPAIADHLGRIFRLPRTSSPGSPWRCCACSPSLRGCAARASWGEAARREASAPRRESGWASRRRPPRGRSTATGRSSPIRSISAESRNSSPR